ncbi:ubinuclein-1 isoform X2 [Hippocampus zosterae]|uniref:ubinuclein-1 isoform X2 n=1 Tax=Hippocampus zosterae TaxID=109293 RepID=UPI00223CEB14|nr:ubinuclein-1 isoform X2 [Hippocampus zosterae]
MAQPRRVEFTSLPSDVRSCAVNGTVLAPKSPPERGGGSRPTVDCVPGSVRLVIALFEPDERSFSEFSYTQLLESKSNKNNEVKPRSRFEVEEQWEKEQMADLARKMEKKYTVKKKQDRVQDLIDIGYGYDDEDSFIDNSEAYDEFVPSSITTKFGGFYVNSGVLHFRQVSDTETDDGTTGERTPETAKKRDLKDGQEMPKKKRRRKVLLDKNDDEANSRVSSELAVGDELMMTMKKKKKKAAGTLSVTSMLKKFRREKERERKKMEKAKQRMASIPLSPVTPHCPADAGGGGGSGLADPLLSLIGSTDEQALLQAASTVEFDIDLDCLLDVGDEISTPQSLMEAPPPNQPRTDHPQPPGASCDATQPPSRKMTQSQKPNSEVVTSLHCAVLPEGLPPPLESSIKKLMLAAKTAEGESKLKFFTPEINSVLLDIECQCREHGGQLRSWVYTHLSSFLPCSKETLRKRVKKLKLAEGLSNMGDPMQKLNEAIGRAMPEQITCFNQHCQEYEQVKTLRMMEDGSDVRHGGIGNNMEEKGAKRGGGPKKLFRWNEEIRELLRHVLREKLAVFQERSEGRQQLEECLKAILVKDIKPLWPKGWMPSRVLLSESRKILGLRLTFPTKRSRSEKKQLSFIAPPVLDQNMGPLPLKVELPCEANSVVEASNASCVTMEDPEVIVLDSDSSPTPSDESPVILTDQSWAHLGPPVPPHELFAAAIAKYENSLHRWSFSAASGGSPLPPPPPPQCSPVTFPEAGLLRHMVLPKVLQDSTGGPADCGPELQMGSDDVNV